MKPWWDKLTKSKGIFCDDTYSCCFPSSGADYVDDEIEGEDVSLPDFDKAGWDGLQREEFSLEEVEVMWLQQRLCVGWVQTPIAWRSGMRALVTGTLLANKVRSSSVWQSLDLIPRFTAMHLPLVTPMAVHPMV